MDGIYRIVNIKNGKFYLGSSKNIKKRWYQHKSHLRGNTHHSIHLQRAWNKYGEESFKFEIMYETKNLQEEEQKLLDELKPWDPSIGYNVSKYQSGGDLISYHPNIEEIKQKKREKGKDWWNSLTKEEKKEYSQRYERESNPNWQGGKTYFVCPKCGKETRTTSNVSRKTCYTCRVRTGKYNPFYGRTHSEETKKKLSKIHSERGNSTNVQKIQVEVGGVIYSSMSVAAKELGCAVATIRNRIENPKFPDYKIIQPSEL